MKDLGKNLPSQAEIEKIKSERHLSNFIKYAWHTIEPGNEYIHNWHIDCISEYLEAVNKGEITRLLVNIAPRFMKSITATVMYPVWTWIHNPYKRFISISYSDALTLKHADSRRNVIMSRWFQQKWGDAFYIKIPRSVKRQRNKGKEINTERNTQHMLENDKKGFFFSSTINGTITGEGGDVIIVDDPHNPKKAMSDAERNAAINIFKSTIQSRFNNLKTGALIVVMQRLHDKDLSGYILANDSSYVHLKLPAKAKQNFIINFPVSKTIKEIKEGELLFEKRVGAEELEKQRKIMGSEDFECQYQQDPAPEGGGIIKKFWIKYWQYPGQNLPPVVVRLPTGKFEEIIPVTLPNVFHEKIQSWDLAFEKNQNTDYVAGQVHARDGANIYMIDYLKEKLSFTESIQAIRNMIAKHPDAYKKYVEKKANGPAVKDQLQQKVSGIMLVEPLGDKEARLHTASVPVESGNVYLPHPSLFVWVDSFIDTLTKFPKVEHDDDVDAFSQAIIKLMERNELVEEEVDW